MAKRSKNLLRPNVFFFHDYRDFLKHFFEFVKSERRLSLRALAKQLNVSVSGLSMILSRKRNLQEDLATQILEVLKLSDSEKTYFFELMKISDSDSFEERSKALQKIQSFKSYRQSNSKELEVFTYLSKWYYVAIREMTALPDFQLDVAWIQQRLQVKVAAHEIQEAIEFLLNNQYIAVDEQGRVQKPEVQLNCISGVYRLSLGEYYRQMFDLAANAFEQVPREERNFMSHTVAVPEESVPELLELITKFTERIVSRLESKSVSKSDASARAKSKKKRVYHFGLQAFPLSKKIKDQGES